MKTRFFPLLKLKWCDF